MGIVYGEEETDWFQLEMWNRDAEYAAKVCKKGGRVGVTVSFFLFTRADALVVVVLMVLLLFLLLLILLLLLLAKWPCCWWL